MTELLSRDIYLAFYGDFGCDIINYETKEKKNEIRDERGIKEIFQFWDPLKIIYLTNKNDVKVLDLKTTEVKLITHIKTKDKKITFDQFDDGRVTLFTSGRIIDI